MNTTEQDLLRFNGFARERMTATAAEPSLLELMDLWQLENSAPDLAAENVAAVEAALVDFKNGDRGQPAGVLSQQLRARLQAK